MKPVLRAWVCVFVVLLGTRADCSLAGKVKVACIGDSITFGYGSTSSYPAQLQLLLGDGYEVRNFGSSGRGVIRSSRRGAGWRAYLKQPEHQRALAFQPDVVICNLGINDMDAYRDCHADEFAPDFVALLRAYKELPSKPKLFLWTKLAPLFEQQKHFEWEEPFLMRQDLDRVAAETGAVGLDMFSGLVGRKELFLPDALHPNEEGYKVIARLTHDQIKPHLTGDFGGLKLPYVFGDHMVLQRGKQLSIHGTANAGQEIVVRLAGQTAETIAGEDGRWCVSLPPMAAGGPHRLEVEGERTTAFDDVMVGEVWIAAGQSNMEWPLEKCATAAVELARASNPRIRLLNRLRTVPGGKSSWSGSELDRCTPAGFYTGSWAVCEPETAAPFSGVAYFFAKKLQAELRVPVGVISVPVGGTTCESFISERALLGDPILRRQIASNGYWFDNEQGPEWPRQRAREQLAAWLEAPAGPLPGHPFEPSFLYRAAIEPIGGFALRGCLWYQGESNATRTDGSVAVPKKQVRAGLETLIADWRRLFRQGDVPFYYVQLPGCNRNWMEFREMQCEVADDLPNVGMAVAIDVGHPTDVHPTRKQPVGERLAGLALAKAYGRDIPCSGPVPRELRAVGDQLEVLFDHADGLQPAQGAEVIGFEVAGRDGVYHPAEARVQGGSVLLHSVGVPKPVSVRYGWGMDPECNLVNSAHLPASPFRAGGAGQNE